LQETAALALQELSTGYLQALLPQAQLARQAVNETTGNTSDQLPKVFEFTNGTASDWRF
jgi:hypothetical protein